jgi:hypothetical protein
MFSFLPLANTRHLPVQPIRSTSNTDPQKMNPPSKPGSTIQKDVKRLVHTCLHLCKKVCTNLHMDNLHTDIWEFTVSAYDVISV